ncbi:SARP family transcriptional regulator [Actinorhabdospora filicis]|uniref:SARP family transcriptional regulator n=1 Tax=Actinorhabdospora filicis TaxID=1785913 RepID=A0A9W6SHY9_9ACTN|nr:BTAD domain-containing putative transcriptional regulator [Actinorhabdospora filicis]GLZ76623.1 SARP family transcriptional regulator [Actinorhabdospora filicis]
MQIGILGPFEVRTTEGDIADVPGARLRGLLIALALEAGHAVPKGTLIDWIWGEQPPSDAANALQRLVSRLRKALPEGTVDGQTDGYRLTVDPESVDAVRFERLVARARDDDGPQRVRNLREALGLWRGGAMQDVGLPESAAFDAAATRLEGLRLTAMEERFDAELDLGNGAKLVTELTDLVAAHPVRERLVASLMRALVASGRDSEALMVYQRASDTLADTLGVDPSPELSALHVALLRGELGRRDEERKTNLREELTSYVGKDADVTAVAGLIAGHRLTTLIGPGGSGKTRLATETARTMLGDVPDGAWLVELAAIGADGDVAQATLAGLGLRDSLLGESAGAEPVERLIAAIRERDMLLVLDNCEHVIESAAALAHRLLGECRRLRVLATSREPLGITGEALWPVAPLALPDAEADLGAIEASPSVRLLRDRAAAVRKDVTADAATLRTMARVCRVLDGMPLAIELAAARLRTMSIEQLANRLDDRFRLLTGGSRTALPRHRTLRAMVDWSWELLTEAERAVLRRLSVFSGGASLEAAEWVCAGEPVEQWEVLDLITALTEKSLLVTTGDDDAPRYRMLGTIKEYADQRLTEAGETDATRRAHLTFFTQLAETAEPNLRRAEQIEWLNVLHAERDNIGAAMRGAIASGDARAAMWLGANAGWFWWLAGYKAEGMELLRATVDLPGEVPDDIIATVYALLVMFATTGPGDENHAATWIHKAYEHGKRGDGDHPGIALIAPLEQMLRDPSSASRAFEPVLNNPDPWVRALARLQVGKMRTVLGDPGLEADAYLETALVEFQAIGERFGISFALSELAERIAARGELAEACEYYEEAIAAVKEIGAHDDVIRLRAQQSSLYWLKGDREACAAALAEADRFAERVAWPGTLAVLALAKADVARWNGDAEAAREQIVKATAVMGSDGAQIAISVHHMLGYLAEDTGSSREQRVLEVAAVTAGGHAPLIARTMVGLADLALRGDRPELAARLLGAGETLSGLVNHAHPDYARAEQDARNRLGDAKFTEAVREGAGTPWAELAEVTLAS